MTSPHGKGAGERVNPTVRWSVMLSASLATRVGICDGVPSTGHSSFIIIREAQINISMGKMSLSCSLINW